MTAKNKQRRAQYMQRVKKRRTAAAAAEEAQRVEAIRSDCLRQMLAAGFTEHDFRRVGNQADSRRMRLDALVAMVIAEKGRLRPGQCPDCIEYLSNGGHADCPSSRAPIQDTSSPPPRRALVRNPMLRTLLAMSLLALPTDPNPSR